MKKRLSNKTLSRWILMLLMMVTGITQGVAQNVTIGPNNGSIITGQAGGNVDDSGIGRGMGSMWRHEQLPLTMTTSDIAMLTSAGELADPSCAIDKYTVNGKQRLLIGAGQTQTFIVVSLPKGYRITGYKLVVQPNVYGNGIQLHDGKNTWDIGTNDHMRIYETEPWSLIAPYTTGNNGNSSNTHCDITDLGAHGYSFITVAHEVGNSGNLDMYNDTEANRAKEFVIEREATEISEGEWDMNNQLHFFFGSHGDGHDSPYQYAVTIKSFEIWFTAEGTFNADLTPNKAGAAVSAVQSPFTTSKMDIGALQYNNQTQLYYYDYTKVQDLIAYNWLYQEDAISDGVPTSDATNKNIYPLVVDGNGVLAFGNDTYFVEPPTTIRTASGWESPIGYRVVGADFKCNWGTATPEGNIQVASGYRIQSGNRYLNDHLDFADVNQNNAFIWHEDEYHNLYFETTVGTGTSARTYRKYLACFGEGATRMLSLSSSASGTEATWNLKIDNDNHLYYESDSHNMYYLHVEDRQEGSTTHYRGYVTLNQTTDLAIAASTGGNVNIPVPAFNPDSYTLEIYDKTGTSVVETIEVTESNAGTDATKYKLEGLNNDAVKFKISGLANGCQALVNITLHLEALNPYIDKMDIVCHDEVNTETGKPNLELTQSFTSNDFSVSGGKFIFYVPTDYRDVPLTFTFSDLYSKYGDNTYYNDVEHMQMNGNARYSYVTSDYFKLFSGNQVGGINDFPVNGGLYDTAYKTNNKGSNGPDAGTGNYFPYTSKVFTSTAGNVRFKFNNAEDLASSTGSLIEYPFSATTYLSNYGDPDWKQSSGKPQETGAFIPCILIANPDASPTGTQYQKTDIFYVFTADETRYNIAPTTGLQHRSYAFYRMDIELEARTFTPKFTYEKIYDKTLQLVDVKDAQGNVTDTKEIEDSMWGLTLDAEEELDEVTGDKIIGYFTYQEIIDHIQGRGNPGETGYIAPTLDPTNTKAPKYMRQILYVDGTKLSAMLNSSKNSVIKRLQDLKDSLAVNNLVFLPVNTTSTLDNTAFKTLSGTFRAGKDIVLKDKQPFFSPYDIQVDAANRATYTRQLTLPEYGQAVNATVMLPFTLTLENGLHTNDDGKCSFTVNTMANNAQMATVEGSSVNYGTAYFEKLTESVTKANKPYMIKVENIDESVSENNTISFIATQKGSSIVKTPDLTDPEVTVTLPGFSGKLIPGETAQAKYNTYDYYFKNYASYSGGKFDRAVSENVFYFSKNKYVDLHTLYVDPNNVEAWRYLMSYPFRGVYTYSASGSGAKMNGFYISYDLDEMESAGFTTGLDGLGTKADMMIRSGRGFITITATADQKFAIRTLNGMIFKNVSVSGGNTITVNLPAGIYIVNNTKITVK